MSSKKRKKIAKKDNELMTLSDAIYLPIKATIQAELEAKKLSIKILKKLNAESVNFSYEKVNDAKNSKKYSMKAPLLSIIPQPIIRITDLETDLNFVIKKIQNSKRGIKILGKFARNNARKSVPIINLKVNCTFAFSPEAQQMFYEYLDPKITKRR